MIKSYSPCRALPLVHSWDLASGGPMGARLTEMTETVQCERLWWWWMVVDLINKRNLFNFAAVRREERGVLSVYWAAGGGWDPAGLLSPLSTSQPSHSRNTQLTTDDWPRPIHHSSATVNTGNSLFLMIRFTLNICYIHSMTQDKVQSSDQEIKTNNKLFCLSHFLAWRYAVRHLAWLYMILHCSLTRLHMST